MRQHNIYIRLFAPFSLTLIAVTIVAWIIGTSVFSRVLENRVSRQLVQAAEMVSGANFPITEDVLARLRSLQNAQIYLIDISGNLLGYRGPDSDNMPWRTQVESSYREWLQKGSLDKVIKFKIRETEYLLSIAMMNSRKPTGPVSVAVFTNLSDVRNATLTAALWLAASGFVGILILSTVGHWVASTITRPISKLSEMANRIAGGDRSVRVDIERKDEIGLLATSLNTMAEHIEVSEKKVAESSRLATVGELAARVAHEIRNPLTAIKLQLELLSESLPDTKQKQTIALVDEIRRLELIVSSTLELSRPEKLDRSSVNLNNIVSEIESLLHAQFRHRHIELELKLDSKIPELMLDSDRFKQILLNLLNNAADELPRGGKVRVSTSMNLLSYVELDVEDSGPGISSERRNILFNQAFSDKRTGFGLGLRVTKDLVELHGGTIQIFDSDLGGAKFQIRLMAEAA